MRCYYCPQPATWVVESLIPEHLATAHETYQEYALTCDRIRCAQAGEEWAARVGIFTDRTPVTPSEAEAITGEVAT